MHPEPAPGTSLARKAGAAAIIAIAAFVLLKIVIHVILGVALTVAAVVAVVAIIWAIRQL